MKQAFSLGDQVGDIGRVFGVVFVPAPVQKLPVALDRYPGNQDHHPPAFNQMLSQRRLGSLCQIPGIYNVVHSIQYVFGLSGHADGGKGSKTFSGTDFNTSFQCQGGPAIKNRLVGVAHPGRKPVLSEIRWLRILSVDSRRREAPFRGYKAVDVVGMSNP